MTAGDRPLRVGVAVPAAGMGRRMGGARKPWLELAGRPVLAHALAPFLADARVVAVRVALAPDEAATPPEWIGALDPRIAVVAGGATRARSVERAVAALPDDIDIVLVHDAARPLVTGDIVARVIEAAAAGAGAVAGIPATDTVKQVDESDVVVATPDRSRLWLAQTPQGFPAPMLRAALAALDADPDLEARVTDDASLVELTGGTVRMVEGAPDNLKVTRPGDLPLALFLLGQRGLHVSPPPFRLLFVCTGNTCRSPMAEVIAREGARRRGWTAFEVRSAGTGAFTGDDASAGALHAAGRAGLDLSTHRSTALQPLLLDWADLTLALSHSHLQVVGAMGGAREAQLLADFAAGPGSDGQGGVPDPFGGDEAEYEATFRVIEGLVGQVLDRLEAEGRVR